MDFFEQMEARIPHGEVRTRFAPSPTGYMHVGNLRTALYTWLIARRHHGKFILRIEDTDQGRLVEGAVDVIYKTMAECGLDHDEGPDVGGPVGPYIQSERRELFGKYAKLLCEKGGAYYCFCQKSDEDESEAAPGEIKKHVCACRDLPLEEAKKRVEAGEPFVIRQRIPHEGTTTFHDASFGDITVENKELEDQVLLKSDGLPTYNFANVVDDHLMGITHVVRGSEYLSSAPKYNLLYEGFGWEVPTYVHCSPVMRDAQHKMSKRNGDPSYEDLKAQGYLTPAILNYVALLGWSPKNGQEIFSREEAVEMFDISAVTRKAAVLDMDKLNHINQEQMKIMDPMKLLAVIRPFWVEMGFDLSGLSDEYLASSLHTMGGRGQTTKQLAEYSDYFVTFDVVKERYDASEIKDETRAVVRKFYNALLTDCAEWKADKMEEFTKEWIAANDSSMKVVCMPLRWALTGRKVSPGVFEVAEQLGRGECRRRLEYYNLV